MQKSVRFARNLSWNLVGQLGIAALNLLMLPHLVRRMGNEDYGLYVLMHAAASYLLLFSFGAGAATIRFVASGSASGDSSALLRSVRYSLAIHVLGVLGGALLLWLGVGWVAGRIFQIPPPLLEKGQFVLRCAAAGSLFVALTQVSLSTLHGLQRFERHNLAVFLQNALLLLGAAAIVHVGYGVRAIGCWYVLSNAAICLGAWLACRPLLPSRADADGQRRLGEQPRFGEFLRWSLAAWFGPLAWIVSHQLDKVLIVRHLPLSDLTLYALPAGLLQRFQVFPSALAHVVIPMMSELRGEGVDEELRRMYLKSLRFLLWMTLPALVLLFVLMPQFLGLWLHSDFGGRSVWPARLLVLTQLAILLLIMPNTAAVGRDRPHYISLIAWAQALISVLVWWIAIPRYELLGVALGTLLGQGVPALFYALHMNRVIGLSFSRYVGEGLRGPALSALLCLGAVLPFHDLATSWPRLGLFALLGAAVFYGSTWLLLSGEDRALAVEALRRLRHRLKAAPSLMP